MSAMETCEKCGKQMKKTYVHGFIDGKFVFSTFCYWCLNETNNYPQTRKETKNE